MKRTSWILCALVALAASSAQAAFNLQITEIWPGNEPGENLTEDWFEITNIGDMPFVFGAANDGELYYDDVSQDAGDASQLTGVASIAPGESVVFVDENGSADFITVWGPDLTSIPQVGDYDGSGLSQGGDGVTLFLTSGGVPTGPGDIIDFEIYPDANAFGGQSYDLTLGAFSGSIGPAITTTVVNDESQPAIGTPGFTVPEPTAAALAALAACGLAARRRG